MDAAVEIASSVVVGNEGNDFYVFEDYVEVANFFRELVAESHLVFVFRSEDEFLSPSACESSTDGVVVFVIIATFDLVGFDVRLSEPYVYACVRESLNGFATNSYRELTICVVVCVSDVYVEWSDRFESFAQ